MRRTGLCVHPLDQFHIWFTWAHNAGLAEPNAMVLATVEADAGVRARTVLLKGYDRFGLRFFTNYGSRKGRALDADPAASAVLPWHPIRRQVIIGGSVERLSAEESDAYFRTRPRGSQIGAWASEHQSSVVADRAALDEGYARAERRWAGVEEVPRPPYWGGYRLRPTEVEFWQGRRDRMHDRFRYVLESGSPADGTWRIDRLEP
ncbi:pyridoxamine 5'-phosphate oxidase [Murinocardiopsis flavida]|uniref:Pyridoxine/pyridoxamine 5'-phosphate oxidase n=2 Tax=Murinocardiopsis flavida TaxID=645275 RepID=A0A2P8DR50_9ACTN|nr:pyridoxamine 5'-phosphate oxidase [Murinocardiopsis flavida]